jgi:hypothetical protein
LLRSPTNRRNHAVMIHLAQATTESKLVLTRIPFQQCLVFPDLATTFPKHSCPLAAFGQLSSRSAALIDHRAGDIHTLLCQNPDIILVGVRWDWSAVRR